ncbi:RWA3 [Scenedesmus sp. PABB004]|nr:RWA3 [Scenedesmus sp. PABB004]
MGAEGAPAAPPAAQTREAALFLPTVGQVSFCVAYLWAIGLYLYALALSRAKTATLAAMKVHLSDPDIESKAHEAIETTALVNGGDKDGAAAAPGGGGGDGGGGGGGSSSVKPSAVLAGFWSTPLFRCLRLEQSAVLGSKDTLLHIVEFGSILVWFYMCDRTNIFWQSEKWYSRDLFWFLFACLTAVAVGSSLQPVRTPLLLNRPQTEEWKGWMQVLFLLYHYFEARELYNAIRIFIAGYVWMTGYGNFTYYYRTGDFSVGRFCQMMWRLNFLVLFCCAVLGNSYMLYYICPMHTIFTVFVYAALGIASHLNKTPAWMWTKIALCFVAVFVLWDVKPVFYAIWGPLDWLVGYTDPRKGANQDRLHEWYFRSGLDRYVWIWGMVCAYLHPAASRALAAVDGLPRLTAAGARAALLAGVAAALAVYYHTVYSLPKLEYNKVHPFTSWIPLTLWIVVRNLTPRCRTFSARLYGWLGCVTLETYLCQFHIWLHSDVPDGQPKYLLCLLPGYPMLNFGLVTALYVFISNRLFHLTNELKDKAVPHDDNATLARNVLQMAVVGGATLGVGWLLERTVVLHLF